MVNRSDEQQDQILLKLQQLIGQERSQALQAALNRIRLANFAHNNPTHNMQPRQEQALAVQADLVRSRLANFHHNNPNDNMQPRQEPAQAVQTDLIRSRLANFFRNNPNLGSNASSFARTLGVRPESRVQKPDHVNHYGHRVRGQSSLNMMNPRMQQQQPTIPVLVVNKPIYILTNAPSVTENLGARDSRILSYSNAGSRDISAGIGNTGDREMDQGEKTEAAEPDLTLKL